MLTIQEIHNEIANFFYACIMVATSLCYCYGVGRLVSKGTTRLLCILPVICLFLFLPLTLHTMHFAGPFSFFIAWLANFKLLLFAFDKGPLSSDPSISLIRFLAVASFPIKIQQSPSHEMDATCIDKDGKRTFIYYVVKTLVLAMVMRAHDLRSYVHPQIVSFLYLLQVYMTLEFVLAMMATLARVLLGVELEPQFNEPYFASSLQDFWGRRWNLMVPSIMRPTVYQPIRGLAACLFGRKWAALPAVMGTFLVSGLMHELMFYYYGRERPSGEITCFFLLHGLCLAAEITVKKAVACRWQLPWMISGLLTMGFVMYTGFWLFLPTMLRCRIFERGTLEIDAFVKFIENVSRGDAIM